MRAAQQTAHQTLPNQDWIAPQSYNEPSPVLAQNDNTVNPQQFFAENGFYILRNAVAPEKLPAYRDLTEAIIEAAQQNPHDIFNNYYLPHRPDQGALYDLYQRFPQFRELAQQDNILNCLAEIFAPNFYLFENSLVYKPKAAENAVPWHQDFMYMTQDSDKVIAWIALDDVTRDNGCLCVIPGSHKNGALPWLEVKGQTHHHRTRKKHVNEAAATPVEMKAGDVLFFHQFLLHSSPKVDTDIKRRAYRFAVHQCDRSYTPRSTPVLLKMTDENLLKQSFPLPAKNGLQKFINRVGNKLAKL